MYHLDALAQELADLDLDYSDTRDILDYLLENDFLNLDEIEQSFASSFADNDNDE